MRKTLVILTILVLVVSSMMWSVALPTAAQTAPTPTYDPRPLCADRTGATTPIVRYDIPYGTVSSGGIYCRPLVQDGKYLVSSAQIGSQAAIDLGIIQAVDVYAILFNGATVTSFNNEFKICLLGTGSIYFLDATQTPRQLAQLSGISDGSYTCASLKSAGIIMLTSLSGAAPLAQGTPGTPQAEGTPLPGVTGTVTPGSTFSGLLDNCTVTVNRTVRLRENRIPPARF
ncbi:MAG: hypothetical protein R3E39_15160 [Anaerolineae bacterium]